MTGVGFEPTNPKIAEIAVCPLSPLGQPVRYGIIDSIPIIID